jgi:hypothetical protein
MVATVQLQFPEHRFQRTGEIESHHDRLRFSWELVGPASDQPVVRGTDFGVLGPDGRLLAVTGFFDGPLGASAAE